MQQLSWCGTNTYPHILMPAALQKIDIDPEQLLYKYTPKKVDNAAAATFQALMKKISKLKEDIHRRHLKTSLALVLVLETDDSIDTLKRARAPKRAIFTRLSTEFWTEIEKPDFNAEKYRAKYTLICALSKEISEIDSRYHGLLLEDETITEVKIE
ncbi:hypothetical protein LAZ67_7001315 [Cordylochernes scorpioides]|uniref:Uncharacterized protein n=1 Tax=Cordylochernes scorpioides TaxID=51811 RepID=A0ABY6KMR1_9ARAC|nr:hypothetical protein LAZ67_7001315 [Cordylochernes scorpioides]